MKRFNVNVNGTAYDVSIEEMGGNAPAAPIAAAAPVAPAAPVAAAPAGAGTKILAPMPGTIMDLKLAVGASVKRGQAIMTLEAMKMENDIPSLVDGTVTSILVKKGDAVKANQVLATVE